MIPAEAKSKLEALLGPRGYLDRPEDLLLYEYDGSVDKARPDMVVFPKSTEEVAAVARIAPSGLTRPNVMMKVSPLAAPVCPVTADTKAGGA